MTTANRRDRALSILLPVSLSGPHTAAGAGWDLDTMGLARCCRPHSDGQAESHHRQALEHHSEIISGDPPSNCHDRRRLAVVEGGTIKSLYPVTDSKRFRGTTLLYAV
ncbi:hypothetical protein OIDMADRAFT_54083 [Oidiodendron maius Zn]|uniref:Uncharacterized protein n=1 Tax=Oidiodendron maius (strain Zn) TaxID=913774 RepID=A0A0C3CPI0_OIDMZ|nr:hypothetical protein OIDMADRAFT_54083 [Oidiodendron maius Zn]